MYRSIFSQTIPGWLKKKYEKRWPTSGSSVSDKILQIINFFGNLIPKNFKIQFILKILIKQVIHTNWLRSIFFLLVIPSTCDHHLYRTYIKAKTLEVPEERFGQGHRKWNNRKLKKRCRWKVNPISKGIIRQCCDFFFFIIF